MIQNTFQNTEQKPVLQSQLLQQEAGIDHFCSMKGFAQPDEGVWMPHQVHGTTILVVDQDLLTRPQPTHLPEADAVITSQIGCWIGVRTADCVPVLLYDPKARVVAAVHAGWRGTVKHIVRLTVEKMKNELGASPQNMLAMIGPSIGPDAFEVGEEVAQAFVDAGRAECVLRQAYSAVNRALFAKPHVDLWQSNAMDLLEAGLELEHIDCTPWCTYEHHEQLFSARRQGIDTGRIVTAICLK